MATELDDPQEQAREFERLFQSVYLTFHRRDQKRSELSGAARAVLTHLAWSGPVTVGEAARHLDRAQSVVSDIVTGLTRSGLLEREQDPHDRRRTLIWLTPRGLARLEQDRRVLSCDLLTQALRGTAVAERQALFDGLRALLEAAPPPLDVPSSGPLAPPTDPTKETQ